jgi:hypothetical protein
MCFLWFRMCAVAVLVLNVFHPGTIFRQSRLVVLALGSSSGGTEMQEPARVPAVRREK